MQRKLRTRKNGGFTIVEVAMAAGVLALAIMSALVAMGRAFAPLDSARCISYASQIMQSEMEKMRLTSWGDGTAAGNGTTGITAYPTTATNLPIDSTFTTAGDLGSRMTMTRTASDVHTGMIKIVITITWTTSDRRTLSRSYITYYGKNGLYDFFAA
jgi:Tfp pilus assembly protein PilV